MSDFKTNFLVTIVFDKDSDIKKQTNTECSFKNGIIKELQLLVNDKEIKHFIVADDEIINSKLKEELKTGHWINIDEKTAVCSCCNRNNLLYGDFCKWCGAKMIEPQESEE